MQSNGLLPQQSTGSRLPYYYSLPPSFTTEQDSLSLWFLVPGDPAPPAEVNIRSSHRVDGLKEAINEKRIRLGYQLVPGMVLWKVQTPIPLCRRTGAERIAFARRIDELRFPDPDSDGGMDGKGPVQLLDEVEDVSHYWQKQPKPKHLHIIVQAPSIARPLRMGPEDKTEAPVDFCILWKKTWDRKEDNIPWFTLTGASRDSTLTVPVLVPQHFWVFSPPDTIAQTLKLDPRTILVREDYNRVLNELFKSSGWSDFAPPNRNSGATFYNPFTRAKFQHKPSRIGFVLIGHTGTGKSTWLRILLVLRLCARLPTFYQVNDDQTVLFTKKGAIMLRLDSEALDHYVNEERTAWVLVDSTVSTPSPKFTDTGIFVVRTQSRSDRMEGLDKYVGFELCRLALWSPAEIICAAPFQRIRHKEKSLIDFCNLHGWSAGKAYSNASNASKAVLRVKIPIFTQETLNPASTSSAPPHPDDEQNDEDDDGDGDGSGEELRGSSEAGGASPSGSEEHPPNSPSRRSLRKSVQTVKVLEVGNKIKASKMKTVIKFLPYDPSKHSGWAKKCNRCAVRDAECFGPVYRLDGTLSSSERCHNCAAGHLRCEKGFFKKPSSSAHPSPPGDTIIVRPRAVPPVDHPSASSVRPSAPKASSSTTAAGKRVTQNVAKMRANIKLGASMDVDDSFGTAYDLPSQANSSRKRPAVTQQVDISEPPFHKVARTSKTSLVPRHTGSDLSYNPYQIPPRTSPSPPNISHSISEPPEDDPILIQLDSPETSIFGDHEGRLRRLADIRRVYHELQKHKGSERSASTNRGSTSVGHPSTDEPATIVPLDSLQQNAWPTSLPAGLRPLDILALLQPRTELRPA